MEKKISFADFYICYVDCIKKEVVVLFYIPDTLTRQEGCYIYMQVY